MIRFELKGLPEVQRDLKLLGFATQQQVLNKAVREGAKIIRDRVAQLAPRDTGMLARSIIVTAAGQRNDLNRVVYLIGPSQDAFYGLFLEVGTAFISPRPFLGPAFIQMETQAIAKIAEVLRREIDKRLALSLPVAA